ncbi:MAG: tetratricopeptide repeat protein [Elusimicrobiota bacterium]
MSRLFPRIPSAAALAAGVLLAGCAGLPARRIQSDVAAGRTEGAYVAGVPFERQKPGHCGPAALSSLLNHWGRPATQEGLGREIYRKEIGGTLGFDLWRTARRAGLASLEAPGLEPAALEALLAQGVPVILNMELGPSRHFILAVGRDARRGFWVFHDGRRPDRTFTDAQLMKRWERTGRWALVAFPPDKLVTGLSPELHLQAADRAEELKEPAAALHHLDRVLPARESDGALWLRAANLGAGLGRREAAESAYRRAMALNPENPDAPNNLAALLAEDAGRLAEAEGLARRALALCAPAPADGLRRGYILDTLGGVLEKRGRPKEAARAYRSALAALPPEAPLARDIRRRLAAASSPKGNGK